MNKLPQIDELLTFSSDKIAKALSSGNLTAIERDIVLGKLARAYELLLSVPVTETPVRTTITGKSAKSSVATGTRHFSSVKTDKTSPSEPPIEPSTPSQSAEQAHPENGTPILAEKYQGKQKFRNEIIADHSTKIDMSEKLKNRPIDNLQKAIGINDKFLFIKELFNGDATLYNETLQLLNEMDDLNRAIIYIQDNFKWDDSNETTIKFIDLIRRKFVR